MPPHSWLAKFKYAFRGLADAVASEHSFLVHSAASLAVFVLGFYFHVSSVEWCCLIVAIGFVLFAELVNTSIERLARAVTQENNEFIRMSLDVAAGAVFVAAVCAVVIGIVIFYPHLRNYSAADLP